MTRTARIAAAFLSSLAVACAGARAPPAAARADAPSSEVLARGEGFTITVDDYRARLAEQKEDVRARFATPEKRREFLRNLVTFELLATEARRQGLERRPEVVFVMKKVMVQQLVRDRFSYEGDRAEKTKAFDAFVESLRARSNVQVNGAALESLVLDANVPASPPPAR